MSVVSSIIIENFVLLNVFSISDLNSSAKTCLMMLRVFVRLLANFFAKLESGNMSDTRSDRWSIDLKNK